MKRKLLISILLIISATLVFGRSRYGFSKITEITNAVGIDAPNPTAELDVGGGTRTSIDGTDDILVKDDVEIDDDLFVTDDATVGGDVAVTGTITVGNGITITGASSVSETATCDDLSVTDDATIGDDAIISGVISVGETAYFDAEYDNGNSSTSDTINWRIGNKQKSTLTGNCTFTFTEPAGACSLILKLVQDSTGSRTVTWPSDVKWPNNTAPTLTTTASAIDLISFYYDGTDFYGLSGFNFQ